MFGLGKLPEYWYQTFDQYMTLHYASLSRGFSTCEEHRNTETSRQLLLVHQASTLTLEMFRNSPLVENGSSKVGWWKGEYCLANG